MIIQGDHPRQPQRGQLQWENELPTLADTLTREELDSGRICPSLTLRIREVSTRIALVTAELAYKFGMADGSKPDDLPDRIQSQMFDPVYKSYV